ncbi:hypothetical protein KJK34_03230 [Flavobacterium sp. D11R37]|uniref:hypothetical protein n=1 Tax=Flavobacterium coralii TaxID=2838017 RepID=UPI001CA6B7E6|nr:hypothetical protein [Flavobacterium coralii]MBY8961759.1 hypothetical protein [Flavobacterium coralii]
MILKNFDKSNELIDYTDGQYVRLSNPAESDGYYQNHAIGFIIFNPNKDLFLINDKKFTISEIGNIVYNSSGNYREVIILDKKKHIKGNYSYELIYTEANSIEFIFELPTDDEIDILKYASNFFESKK